VGFDVYEDNDGQRGRLVFRAPGEGTPSPSWSGSLHIAERTWQIVMRSQQPSVASAAAPRTLLVGLLLSLLLFLISRGQLRALVTSTRHEAELRTSEQALRKSELELTATVARERDARSQIEAADRAKDEFLATLSHELRTPLNTMLGWLAMMRSGSMRDDQRVHALQVIERNARLQAQLIEDLLDVSRIVMGKVRLILHPVSLAPVVSTVVESIRPTAEAKGVTLHAAITQEGGRLWGDSARLQQVVWNLLANAVKFTAPGGHVSVELTQDKQSLQLTVRDDGIGIAPEFLPHVFERFRQADSSMTRAHGGVGLGLSIVRDLVELHDGSIEAHSDGPNHGATFVVRLPALPAQAGAASLSDNIHVAPALSGIRVLVVDDDAETRVLLSEALSLTGAQVTTAKSAREAFEELTTHGADVLVSDVGMPDEDGLSLMRRIRSLPQGPTRVPAIALTAYARPSDRSKAMEAGYEMYFAKPVEIAALQAGLAKLTGRDSGQHAPT
jgi:signal transduction histidine kinase/ActR/RegA family two-component response regulator